MDQYSLSLSRLLSLSQGHDKNYKLNSENRSGVGVNWKNGNRQFGGDCAFQFLSPLPTRKIPKASLGVTFEAFLWHDFEIL